MSRNRHWTNNGQSASKPLIRRGTFIDYNLATQMGDGIVRPLRKLWGTTVHVGALDYIKSYGHQGDVVLLVKVNPRDAVSVPSDHNAQKLRVCRYEVLSVYEGGSDLLGEKVELDRACYSDDGSEYDDDEYDDDDNDPYNPCDNCEAEVKCKDCSYGQLLENENQ